MRRRRAAVHLYRSGAAGPEELVGLAGLYRSPPSGAACDGGLPPYFAR
jgi:hypothetical protein